MVWISASRFSIGRETHMLYQARWADKPLATQPFEIKRFNFWADSGAVREGQQRS